MSTLKTIVQKIKMIILHFFWYTTRRNRIVRVGGAILIFALITGKVVTRTDTPTTQPALPPVVYVGTVSSISSNQSASFVGTVRAVDEAQIQSEVQGRVTSVRVKAGDTVSAGAVLATLEKATQEATLLQAQGAYETALANAAQSDVSASDAQNVLKSAQNNALTVYQNAYTTVSTIVFTDIDMFFGDPNSIGTPGVRINSYGNTDFLNTARKSLRTTLTEWKESIPVLTRNSDLASSLKDARTHTQKTLDIIDILISSIQRAEKNETLDGKPLQDYITVLSAKRGLLVQTLSSIANAETTLASAQENVRRAEIIGTNTTETSLANAQVKQALGVLRGAQAQYEKTIFRSPIAGVVNTLSIKTGDFISMLSPIATIANNDALQISIYVSEKDIMQFAVGEKVLIEDTIEGTIASIAPALDPSTQKIEVIIATESDTLKNGNTVSIRLKQVASNENVPASPIRIPLTAIKFEAHKGSILVVENGILVAKEVTLGPIYNALITIEDGMTRDTVFVLDVRGKNAGERVEAIQK